MPYIKYSLADFPIWREVSEISLLHLNDEIKAEQISQGFKTNILNVYDENSEWIGALNGVRIAALTLGGHEFYKKLYFSSKEYYLKAEKATRKIREIYDSAYPGTGLGFTVTRIILGEICFFQALTEEALFNYEVARSLYNLALSELIENIEPGSAWSDPASYEANKYYRSEIAIRTMLTIDKVNSDTQINPGGAPLKIIYKLLYKPPSKNNVQGYLRLKVFMAKDHKLVYAHPPVVAYQSQEYQIFSEWDGELDDDSYLPSGFYFIELSYFESESMPSKANEIAAKSKDAYMIGQIDWIDKQKSTRYFPLDTQKPKCEIFFTIAGVKPDEGKLHFIVKDNAGYPYFWQKDIPFEEGVAISYVWDGQTEAPLPPLPEKNNDHRSALIAPGDYRAELRFVFNSKKHVSSEVPVTAVSVKCDENPVYLGLRTLIGSKRLILQISPVSIEPVLSIVSSDNNRFKISDAKKEIVENEIVVSLALDGLSATPVEFPEGDVFLSIFLKQKILINFCTLIVVPQYRSHVVPLMSEVVNSIVEYQYNQTSKYVLKTSVSRPVIIKIEDQFGNPLHNVYNGVGVVYENFENVEPSNVTLPENQPIELPDGIFFNGKITDMCGPNIEYWTVPSLDCDEVRAWLTYQGVKMKIPGTDDYGIFKTHCEHVKDYSFKAELRNWYRNFSDAILIIKEDGQVVNIDILIREYVYDICPYPEDPIKVLTDKVRR